MEAYVADWLNLALRWLHFTAGVAWVGASFYFNWVDHSVRPPREPGDGRVSGELWSIHGGAIYHSRKYPRGPEQMPSELHWFKWEAYTTWMSGMALLAVIYWWGASSHLIDRSVLDISVPVGIALSIASIAVGWVIYDQLCRRMQSDANLALVIFVLLVVAAWGFQHVFGARAAYIHVGVVMATIMVGNVFFAIMPGHQRMLDAIRARRTEGLDPGEDARRRSLHNNYFTLPVLFIMISNHYPMTYGHEYGWAILAAISVAGVLIRHFFNLRNTGRTVPALPVAGAAILVAVAIVIAPRPAVSVGEAVAAVPEFGHVQDIIKTRCVACHAATPTYPGFVQPPAGVVLERPDQVQAAAPRIFQSTVATRTMPIANLTGMTEEERADLAAWIGAGAEIR